METILSARAHARVHTHTHTHTYTHTHIHTQTHTHKQTHRCTATPTGTHTSKHSDYKKLNLHSLETWDGWRHFPTQNRKHGMSTVLGKETFLGYIWMSPVRVSVKEEGEAHHSMYMDRKQKRHRNQQQRVWWKESGGREYQKQNGKYGKVCKVEDSYTYSSDKSKPFFLLPGPTDTAT